MGPRLETHPGSGLWLPLAPTATWPSHMLSFAVAGVAVPRTAAEGSGVGQHRYKPPSVLTRAGHPQSCPGVAKNTWCRSPSSVTVRLRSNRAFGTHAVTEPTSTPDIMVLPVPVLPAAINWLVIGDREGRDPGYCVWRLGAKQAWVERLRLRRSSTFRASERGTLQTPSQLFDLYQNGAEPSATSLIYVKVSGRVRRPVVAGD